MKSAHGSNKSLKKDTQKHIKVARILKNVVGS